MNIFEEHGLMLLAAEQGRQQFNRDVTKAVSGWLARCALVVRRFRRRVSGQPIRY